MTAPVPYLATDCIAYVLIKAEPGQALKVAEEMSKLGDVADGGVVRAAVVSGPYDILAGVRVRTRELLADLVVTIQEIEVQTGEESIRVVSSTLTLVWLNGYIDPPPDAPHSGFP
jgi:hypothetical protein